MDRVVDCIATGWVWYWLVSTLKSPYLRLCLRLYIVLPFRNSRVWARRMLLRPCPLVFPCFLLLLLLCASDSYLRRGPAGLPSGAGRLVALYLPGSS